LVTHFGCCAYGGEAAAIERLIDSGVFDTVLVHYSLLNPSAWQACPAESPMRDYRRIGVRAVASGMAAIALRVLDGGALTGTVPIPALSALADETGQSLPTLAMRFVLSKAQVSTALVGFSGLDQIEAAGAASAAGPLPTEALARIERLRRTDFGRATSV
jgi:predicted aldo/keto reductase-like oxidoreductase